MCGIFGLITAEKQRLPAPTLQSAAARLLELSESRGKEAAGLAVVSKDRVSVYKSASCASKMIGQTSFGALFRPSSGEHDCNPFAFVGHSRLVTNGSQANHANNQPVIRNEMVGVHNGIVVNDTALWQRFPSLHREKEVDTEIILALLDEHFRQTGSLIEAARATFAQIEGATSIAVLSAASDYVLLATNTGSLYTAPDPQRRTWAFASEEHILRQLLRSRRWNRLLGEAPIRHIAPGQAMLVHLRDLSSHLFALTDAAPCPAKLSFNGCHRTVVDMSPVTPAPVAPTATPSAARREPTLQLDDDAIASLRRCTRCILPETMPFIEFDGAGVCNYCRIHKYDKAQGRDALDTVVAPHRRSDGRPDCLVTISGGRDSCYSLHYAKTVLGLNPIAFTYDWGMVTDLARRNISRLCGRLGVEHILVAADIPRKRRNIRQNVQAWLRKPCLGLVTLFMAGDKQYFYYADRLKRQTSVSLLLMGENQLERTDFKVGLCGVRPARFDPDHAYALRPWNKARMGLYYAAQYLRNPRYLNASFVDTIGAYLSYYIMPREYVNLYRYIRWDEQEIVSTLTQVYDWERATDTNSTWRIGDGTASFYNAIYYVAAGFTENDTFRSNQVREGLITREEALRLVREENQPRYESIRWYCDAIGVDCAGAIAAINAMPRLYRSSPQRCGRARHPEGAA